MSLAKYSGVLGYDVLLLMGYILWIVSMCLDGYGEVSVKQCQLRCLSTSAYRDSSRVVPGAYYPATISDTIVQDDEIVLFGRSESRKGESYWEKSQERK